jgi:hypothetical protein
MADLYDTMDSSHWSPEEYALKLKERDELERKKIMRMESLKNRYSSKKRERSCLYFFKLETAIIIFTFLDFLFIWLLFLMARYSYGNELPEEEKKQEMND